MSLHSDTLSWFRANQILLLLFNAVWLVEKHQLLISQVFGLNRQGYEPTIYSTRGEHTNHHNTNVVPVKLIAMIYSNVFFLEKLLNQYFCLETFARIGLYKYTFMDVVVL